MEQEVLKLNDDKNNLIAYVCVGLPASGKTKYYKDNIGKTIPTNTEYLDFFNYAKEEIGIHIAKEDIYYYLSIYNESISLFKRKLTKDIKRCYNEGKNIYIANCNLDDNDRIRLRKYLKNLGYRVKILFFTTNPYECLINNTNSKTRVMIPRDYILSYCKDYVFLMYSSKLNRESLRFNEYRNIYYI